MKKLSSDEVAQVARACVEHHQGPEEFWRAAGQDPDAILKAIKENMAWNRSAAIDIIVLAAMSQGWGMRAVADENGDGRPVYDKLVDVLDRTNREWYLSINHDPNKVRESLRWEVRLTIENNDGELKKLRSIRETLDRACFDIAKMVASEMLLEGAS